MNNYVALLRGINVGGRTIKMEELRPVFEKVGMEKVKTLLASGNVVFGSSETDKTALKQTLEAAIEEKFEYHVDVLLRTKVEIDALITADPFGAISVTPQTRLYVTFLTEKPSTKLSIPYATTNKDFQILRVTNSEVCSVLEISPEKKTTDLMKILEQEFGKKVTTRNWNTVVKIGKAFE